MQWKGRRESENVENRRTLTPGRVAAGGGAGILVLALLTYLLGGDPQEVLKLLQNNPQQAAPQGARVPNPAQDELKRFVSVVLADTEDVWREQFRKMGKVYQLEPGDLEAALRAANAIGDDRLQKQARGYVVPASFTHGTSAQAHPLVPA